MRTVTGSSVAKPPLSPAPEKARAGNGHDEHAPPGHGCGAVVVVVVVDVEVVVDVFGWVVVVGAVVVVVGTVVDVVDTGALTVNVAFATAWAPAPVSHQAWTSTGPGPASTGMTTVVDRWSSVAPLCGFDRAGPAVTYQLPTHWL